MWFYTNRLDRLEKLIKEGDLEGALKRIETLDIAARQSRSNLVILFERIETFNKNIKFLVSFLKDGRKKEALIVLSDLRKILDKIYLYSKLINKENKDIK